MGETRKNILKAELLAREGIGLLAFSKKGRRWLIKDMKKDVSKSEEFIKRRKKQISIINKWKKIDVKDVGTKKLLKDLTIPSKKEMRLRKFM